jgi:hypothetical protein
MGLVFKPLPPPEDAAALAFWYERATGHPPAPGVNPRQEAMGAWYRYARQDAVDAIERQRRAFPWLLGWRKRP